MTCKKLAYALIVSALLFTSVAFAEDERPKSPPGMSSTQIGDAWIDITYSRPILRGRDNIFGSGEEYGKTVNGGADYWRAGANASTKIKTEVDLEIGGKKVPAGEYAIVVGLAEDQWTLVLTTQETMETWQGREAVAKGIMWGSYGYKPDQDVARAAMTLLKLEHRIDQLTYSFVDVDDTGATLVIAWDKTAALTRLAVAK